jgi:type IV secretory pathway TrbL component
MFPAFLIQLLIVLLIAGLILWAISQFPLDPTIARIVRVVIIVVVVIYLIYALVPLLGGPWIPSPSRALILAC